MAINPEYPIKPEVDTNLLAGGGPDAVGGGPTYTDPNYAVPNDQAKPVVDISLLPGVPGQRGPTGPTGATGRPFEILGTYASYAALVAAHPIGVEGDFYRVDHNLYGWSVFLDAWQDLGQFTGDTGPSGTVSVTSPITNSGTSTAAQIGLDQTALQITESQVTNLVSDLAAKETPAGAQSKADAAQAAAISTSEGYTDTKIAAEVTRANAAYDATGSAATAQTNAYSYTDTAVAPLAPKANPSFTGTINGVNLNLTGDFTINGTATTINTTNLEVTDSIIYLASNQYNADLLDIGIYGAYGDPNPGHFHTGLVRDHTDGVWKLFSGGTEPSDSIVNFTGINYDALKLGGLTITGLSTAGYVKNNSSGVISTSAAIPQSDVTGLATSLAAKANLAGGNSFTAAQVLTADATTTTPLAVKGIASQSADITQWYNSAGTLATRIGSDGRIYSPISIRTTGLTSFSNNGSAFAIGDASAAVVTPGSASLQAIIIKGAASQSGNLQEWQDSTGAVLSAVSSVGVIRSWAFAGMTAGLTSMQPNYDTSGMGIVVGGTTQKGLVVRGVASHAANLQEWQESSGSVNTAVNQYGQMRIRTFGASVNDVALAAFGAYATEKALVARGSSGQTANIFEVQDSTGSALFSVSPYSETWNKGNVYVGSAGNYGRLSVLTQASVIGAVIRGAASQTADLQQWQDSSANVLGSFDASGTLKVQGTQTWYTQLQPNNLIFSRNAATYISNSTASGYLIHSVTTTTPGDTVVWSSGATVGLTLNPNGALPVSTVPLKVKGTASQTANLTEWQNSSGTVLASISSAGVATFTQPVYANDNAAGTVGLQVKRTLLQFGTVTTEVGAIIRGVASQTADLQQWQDSTNAVKASIGATGILTLAAPAGATGYANFPGGVTLGQQGNNEIVIRNLTQLRFENGNNWDYNMWAGIGFDSTTKNLYIGGPTAASGTFSSNAGAQRFIGNLVGLSTLNIDARNTVLQSRGTNTKLTVKGKTGTVSISTVSGSGSVVTFTTAASHFFDIGDTVTITGVSPTAYNLTNVTISNVPSQGVFTVNNTATGTYVSGGTATVVQASNLQEWQDASATVLAKVDQNGVIWSKSNSATGYLTTNPTTANMYQWTKFATFSMTSQYLNTVAVVDFNSSGPGNTDIAHGRLFLSFKQQNVMGQPPEAPTMFLYNGFNVNITDFAAVLIQNDATATKYDVYVRVNNAYEGIYFNPVMVSDTTNITFYDAQPFVTNLPAGVGMTVNTTNPPETEILPIDNLSNYFNGVTQRFQITSNGVAQTVKNPFRLMVSVNGVVQTVNTPEYAWQSPIPYDGFFVDADSYINFSEIPAPGFTFDGRLLAGAATSLKTKNYPFRAVDLLIGA